MGAQISYLVDGKVPVGWKFQLITSLKSSLVGNSSKWLENIQGWKAYQARISELILSAGSFRADGCSKGLEIFPSEDERDNVNCFPRPIIFTVEDWVRARLPSHGLKSFRQGELNPLAG